MRIYISFSRGFHIYCVGLKAIPGGRWQCEVGFHLIILCGRLRFTLFFTFKSCNECVSCKSKSPAGNGCLEPLDSKLKKEGEEKGWVFETKTSLKGEKIYSHTMCLPCHRQWKKGNYCPECNGVFGIDPKSNIVSRLIF